MANFRTCSRHVRFRDYNRYNASSALVFYCLQDFGNLGVPEVQIVEDEADVEFILAFTVFFNLGIWMRMQLSFLQSTLKILVQLWVGLIRTWGLLSWCCLIIVKSVCTFEGGLKSFVKYNAFCFCKFSGPKQR